MVSLLLSLAVVSGFVDQPPSEPPVVTFTLSSPSSGLRVRAGTLVSWTITASASAGDNLGLASFSVNLVQDSANPSHFEMAAGDGPPSGMTGFSRPLGIGNPGPGGAGSGYGGTPLGPAGSKDLVQIGGAQNTLGVSGGTIGKSIVVATGIGQSGPQIVATGTILAPRVQGVYVFRLTNTSANTLRQVNAPPQFSHAIQADISLVGGSFAFAVCCYPNCDCGTDVPYLNVADFNCFLNAFASGSAYANCDGSTVVPVLNVADFTCFLNSFAAGCSAP